MVPAAFEQAGQRGVTPNSVAVNNHDEPRRDRVSSQQQTQREKDRDTAI